MKKLVPKVSNMTLILIAGLVWCAVGFKILAIGFPNMIHNWTMPIIAISTSIIIFGLFFKFIFLRMVGKHILRIRGYKEEKIVFYKFFDAKSYLIMVFMMTFGILIRNSQILPLVCLGTFYVGLGSALAGAGIDFLLEFVKVKYCQRA